MKGRETMRNNSNRQKLIRLLAKRYNRTEKETKILLEEFENGMKDILLKHNYIGIKGIGTIRIIKKKETKRHNPITGEVIQVPEKLRLSMTTYQSFQNNLNLKFNKGEFNNEI